MDGLDNLEERESATDYVSWGEVKSSRLSKVDRFRLSRRCQSLSYGNYLGINEIDSWREV